VTSLKPNTTYWFAIKTADDAGNLSGISNIASITTPGMITFRKTCDKRYILPGGTLTYTITYTNEGSGAATDVTIIEVLPEHTVLKGVRYWYNGRQTNFTESTTKIKWVIPQVAPGEMGTVSFTCEVR